MVKFSISNFRIFNSFLFLKKVYLNPQFLMSLPLHFFDLGRSWITFSFICSDFHDLGWQLQNFGRITMHLDLSAMLHCGWKNQFLHFVIYNFYVPNLYLIPNSRVYVNDVTLINKISLPFI